MSQVTPPPADEFALTLDFRHYADFAADYGRSVSSEGIFVALAEPPPVGTTVIVEVRIRGNLTILHGRGAVVWTRDEASGDARPAGMAVRFDRLDEGGRGLVERMVERQREQGLEPFSLEPRGPTTSAPPARHAEPPLEALDLPAADRPAEDHDDAPTPGPPDVAELSTTPLRGDVPRAAAPRRPAVSPLFLVLIVIAFGAGAVIQLVSDRIHLDATSPLEPETLDIPPQGVTPSPPERPRVTEEEPLALRGDQEPPAAVPPEPHPPSAPLADTVRTVSWSEERGGTTVTLVGNGALIEQRLSRARLPAREVLKIRGIDRPFRQAVVPVGGREVLQIRTGFHPDPTGNELHVVIDVRDDRVVLDEVVASGVRLDLHFAATGAEPIHRRPTDPSSTIGANESTPDPTNDATTR